MIPLDLQDCKGIDRTGSGPRVGFMAASGHLLNQLQDLTSIEMVAVLSVPRALASRNQLVRGYLVTA